MLSLFTLASVVHLLAAPAAATLTQGQAPLPSVDACSLLPKEEVKKRLPWEPVFDQMPLEEEI